MKKILTIIFILFSSCQIFLGPDHDTSPESVLTCLWNDFNEIHAYIDIRLTNSINNFSKWEDALLYYKERLSGNIRPQLSLFESCGQMLAELRDPHVGLYAPGRSFHSSIPDDVLTERGWFQFRNNDNNSTVQRRLYLDDGGVFSAVPDLMFLYGLFNEPYETIGYIHIKSFSDSSNFGGTQGWVTQINDIVDFFNTVTDAVIVDIRNNDGGSTANMEYIASRFATVKKDYLRISNKNGPGRNDFTAPVTNSIQPEGTRYAKNVVLLTNKSSVSAAEWFTLAMRAQPHVQHMGTATRGALSSRMARPMVNGWYYTISADKVEDINGKCYEGVGIRPENPEHYITGVWEFWEVSEGYNDRQLNHVLEYLASLP